MFLGRVTWKCKGVRDEDAELFCCMGCMTVDGGEKVKVEGAAVISYIPCGEWSMGARWMPEFESVNHEKCGCTNRSGAQADRGRGWA